MKKRYKQRDVKLLWSLSGGRCAFENCRSEIPIPYVAKSVREMAHIVSGSASGPRSDADYPQDSINIYENLILLCHDHHREVDSPSSSWTAEELKELKHRHEEWVRETLRCRHDPFSEIAAHATLFVLAGPSGVGKDVLVSRMYKLFHKAVILRKYTTRGRRSWEIDGQPFVYMDSEEEFHLGVRDGRISCVHEAFGYFYGLDSNFGADYPAGSIILTSLGVYEFIDLVKTRARARGIDVVPLLITADEETLKDRIQWRTTDQKEQQIRMKSADRDLHWIKINRNRKNTLFKYEIDNSDDKPLRQTVEDIRSIIVAHLSQLER